MRISDWSSDVCSSDLHAFAMQQRVGKARIGFQRMAEGMAKVEEGATARCFAFVVGDDGGFGPDAAFDRIFAGFGVARQQLVPLPLAPDEEIGIVDQRSDEHTSEHQSLMRIAYDVFCLKQKKHYINR